MLFGAETNSVVTYDGGGRLWVSSAPEQHVLYGYKFTANGTASQLQCLAYRILNQCLASDPKAAAADRSHGTLQWWYLGGHGVQMGPFSADHLQQFMSTSVCHHEQLVCHGPCRVWMPLWLALQLCGVQCAAAPLPPPPPLAAAAAAPNSPQTTAIEQPSSRGGRQVQVPVQRSSRGEVPPNKQQPQHLAAPAAARSHSQTGQAKGKFKQCVNNEDDGDSDDYGAYGASSAWLAKVREVEAATKAKQQAAKQQAAKQQPQSPLQHQQQQQPQSPVQSAQLHLQQARAPAAEVWCDTEMQEACAEAVLEAVSELRGDQAYLEELHRAIEMEWEATAPQVSTQQHRADTHAHQAAGQQDAGSAVQLADLATGAITSSNTLQQRDLLLVLVLDTNVAVQRPMMQFLKHAQRMQQQQGGCLCMELPPTLCQHIHGASAAIAGSCHGGGGGGGSSSGGSLGGSGSTAAVRATVCVRLQVVIPWTVLVELDRLKMRPGYVSHAARAAVEALRRELVVPTHEAGGSVRVNMFSVQSLQEFRQAAQAFDFGVPASSIVADDHILQCALSQMQQLQEQELQQSSPATSWQRCGVLLVTNDKIVQLKAQANHVAVAGVEDIPPLALSASEPMTSSQPMAQVPPCLVHMLSAAGIHPPWLAALASMTQPRPAQLLNRSTKPHSPKFPRSPTKAERCRQQEQQRAQERAEQERQRAQERAEQERQRARERAERAELSSAASSFLAFLRLRLSGQVLEWFQADHEDLWRDVLVNKPPWNDLQFVEVLWHHWMSTIQAHLPVTEKHKAAHLKTVVDYLRSNARRLQQQNFKGVDLHKLSFNLGVRVMEVLTAFCQQEAANQVEAVLSAAAAATTAAPAAAQAQSTEPLLASSTGPNAVNAAAVPAMHAYIDAAAESAAGNGQSAEQRQGQVATAATQQQLQEQHASMALAPQQDSRTAAVAALAAAAAVVAAPAPVGPCLTLSQLLVYAVYLLQAVLPLLGQLLAQAASPAAAQEAGPDAQHAGALSAGMAYEQQLRAVVQQLEQLGQQMSMLQQQQHQQHQALQADILQLGLLLVQLCSLLLHDEAAGGAVSQQLAQHAGDFVPEALVYLMQSQGNLHQAPQAAFMAQSAPGPAVMLQQLTAALQTLQHILSQAMQHP